MNNCILCGSESEKYELCKACFYDYEDGLINKCKCGTYKDSEYALCRVCYKKINTNENQKKTKVSDSGIKGRIAEAIIEEMFLAMDYRVFRFGMENSVPGFGDRYLPKK